MADTMAVTFAHIEQAAARIAGYVHRTPVLGSELLDRAAGCEIRFKCENLQKTGAFKARGAHNAEWLPILREITRRHWHWRPAASVSPHISLCRTMRPR
jgi:threonine dehydratase